MSEIGNKFKKSILAELIYVHYENTRYLLLCCTNSVVL